MGLRKTVAQVGVLAFVISSFVGFIPVNDLPNNITLPLVLFAASWVFVLLVAALIPSNKDEKWGSIWPLSGYDNAIDAIYTRGHWLMRLQELDEQDRERGVTAGMTAPFGGEQA